MFRKVKIQKNGKHFTKGHKCYKWSFLTYEIQDLWVIVSQDFL